MAARTKTRRRLKILGVGVLAVIVTAAGAYAIRRQQVARHVLALRKEGYAALEAGDYFNAMHKIGPYLQRNRTDTEALLKYAQARRHVPAPNAKNISEAMSLYRQLLALDPRHEEASRLLLELYVQYGLNTEVLDFTESRDDLASRRARIIALKRIRRFDEAVPLAERYVELDPRNLQQQIVLLDLLRQQGKPPDKLVERAEKLRGTYPKDPRFELLQSIAYSMNDREADALSWACKAAAHPVDDVEFVRTLVALLDGLGQFEESRSVLERAAATGTESEFMIAAIRRLFDSGQHQAVIDRLAHLSLADPKVDADLLAMRALALIQAGQREQADPIIQALAQRKHDTVAAAWITVLSTVFAEAPAPLKEQIRGCRDAVTASGDNPYFHFYLGEAYAKAAEKMAAMREFAAAHELARAWSAPLSALASTCVTLNRTREALDLAEAARDRAPTDPQALSVLAAAMARNLDSPDSPKVGELLQLLDRIERISPRDARTRALRISLLNELGRKDEAKQMLEACIAMQPPFADTDLIQLATTSQNAGLGLEQVCLEIAEQAHELTPDIALARAFSAHRQGDTKRALDTFTAARKNALNPSSLQWAFASARLLETVRDPSAKQQWIELCANFPEDPLVLQSALNASSVQDDRQFLRATIDRLGSIIGDDGIAWRIADAQWLMSAQRTEKELNKVTLILNDVTKRAPEQAASRRLLAECLVRMEKYEEAVEQLFVAARLEPQPTPVLLRLAGLLQSRGELDQAAPLLTQIQQNLEVASRGRGVDVDNEWRALAQLHTDRGNLDEAIRILEDRRKARTAATTQPSAMDSQLGVLYARRGCLTEAHCRELLLNPDPAAIFIVADFYASTGQPSKAQEALARLEGMKLSAEVPALVRAQYYERHGTPEQALEQLLAATRAAPADAKSWRALIKNHVVNGQADKATDAIRQAQSAIPVDQGFAQLASNADAIAPVLESPPGRALVVTVLEQEQNQAVAIEALRLMSTANKDQATVAQVLPDMRALADLAPRLLPLQQLVATMYLNLGQNEDALRVATRVMRAFPNEPEPARLAAQSLAALGRWPEALSAAEKWKERLGRDSPDADAMLAVAHLATNDPAAASRHVQPHLQAALSDPEKQSTLICLYLQSTVAQNKIDEAAATVGPVLPKLRDVRITWMQLAGAQISDPQTAAAWLQQVEPAVGNTVTEEMMLAQAWFMVAQRSNLPAHASAASLALERAARDLGSAPRTTADEWAGVAMLYDAAGNPDAAERAYRKALELRPDFAEVQNNLAMILCNRNGDLSEAEMLATKAAAHRDHPFRASFLDTLATAQAKSRQDGAAIASLQDAIKLDPMNLKWRLNLARVLRESGQLENAKATLKEVDDLAAQSGQVPAKMLEQIAALRAELQ